MIDEGDGRDIGYDQQGKGAIMAAFDFEQLVFSGGGIRCFWHGGFLAAAGDALALKPERISTVSGGALSAAAWIANRERALLDAMVNAFANNDLRWTHSIGLEGKRVDMRQAARDGKLIDLICAAATIPPVFDVPEWNGLRVLDGGIFDKAPLPKPDIGNTLLLLTSRYRNLPRIDRRTYIQPSEEVAADKIDFSDKLKVEDTWAQGERDGKAWVARNG
ncbi:patatin-like phospholipase family protein [Allohahella marinimesophila]|uniref:PNPLA domain-containing protein n=1 Tax=Allohahella marinimesophila TaxID=1054972 RepID=A0ABP7PT63_9GAMM